MCRDNVGTSVPTCPLVGAGDFIPSATGLSSAALCGDQKKRGWWCQTVSQLQPGIPVCSSKPVAPHIPLLTREALRAGVGVLAAAAAVAAAERRREAVLCC